MVVVSIESGRERVQGREAWLERGQATGSIPSLPVTAPLPKPVSTLR